MTLFRHCEERSDAAIRTEKHGFPRRCAHRPGMTYRKKSGIDFENLLRFSFIVRFFGQCALYGKAVKEIFAIGETSYELIRAFFNLFFRRASN